MFFGKAKGNVSDLGIISTDKPGDIKRLLDSHDPAKAVMVDISKQIKEAQDEINALPNEGYYRGGDTPVVGDRLDLQGGFPKIYGLLVELGNNADLQLVFWKLRIGSRLKDPVYHVDTSPKKNTLDVTGSLSLREDGTGFLRGNQTVFDASVLKQNSVPISEVRKAVRKGIVQEERVKEGVGAFFRTNTGPEALLHTEPPKQQGLTNRVTLIGSYRR